ncbi:hypothetical protein Vadar_011617 [Vaccinium darrowii]|uniref:Uncharacterized protein n=1 Tax=Vaccinium darrowii TaxID=229202 RepID=A0ACB7YD29_9ERIC|nr:hypothetical protein Vadar_011617 [Vaccinium darrowii]
MATENSSVATTATEIPPLVVATETPPVAETPPLVVAIETLPVATTEIETPPVAETPPLVVAIETPPVAITATETPPVATTARKTPPVAETPPLVVATETPPVATMATETPPVSQTPPLVVATNTRPVATTPTEPIPLVLFIIFVLLSTIPALVTGYFLLETHSLLQRGDPDCSNHRLEWDLWYYIFLVVIFAVASICVLFKVMVGQLPGIILLLLTSLSILVTSWSVELGANPYKNPMRIEDVYRLESYAPWAQKFLLRDRGWSDFQNCLIERKICDKPDDKFYQEGCCSPPPYCGYQEKNQTWVVPKTGRYADNVNCVRWDSDKRKCYDCETCQAVYMSDMDETWSLRAMLLLFGFAVLVAFLMLTVAINDPSQWQQKGATKEQIERLPKYKFRKTGENGEILQTTGGIMTRCNTDAPIEHVLSPEDAECSICLCAYEDGTELRELPCRHHFHCSCVDKWLRINATCPLCKSNAIRNRDQRRHSEQV